MVKWVTSLLLLLAVTGQVWAGVCACLEDHNDSHSCCRPDTSGKDSLAAKPCCSSDCEAISSSQIPGKNTDRVSPDPVSGQIEPEIQAKFQHIFPVGATRTAVRSSDLFGHRLKLARPPDALYLRHHSFLI